MVEKSPSIHTGRLLSRHIALMQGGYYLISGIWPLMNMSAFQAVTGPKTDLWLVRTVGLLLIVVGAVLILAAVRGRIDLQITVLGSATAAALLGIELTFVFDGTISAVYLVDALLELIFVVGWVLRQAVTLAGASP